MLTEGGPGGRTMLPMLFTYLEAFKNRNIGYAAAMGVVLVVVVVPPARRLPAVPVPRSDRDEHEAA